MKREQISGYISDDLLDRVRNIVYWSPGMTLTAAVERGLRLFAEEAEAGHGGRFPQRDSPPRTGRSLER